MIPRLILLTSVAVLLAGCDQKAAAPDPQRNAELERQRQAEQAANDKIRQLEQRLDDAEKQKSAEELARTKEELDQVKRDKEVAAQRAREIENEPAPAEAVGEAPRGEAVRADLRHIVEEDDADDSDPVYEGRVVPETQRVADVDSFYEPLDPYGDWLETDDYGYVFRPAVAARGGDWRPYTDGRWVHTDYGWTWESNEDFGWATYHYGRWARVDRTGWVWVPGKEWGPGWVSWRRGDDYCGWAPLPPETRTRGAFTATVDRDFGIGPAAYIFVALTNFGARSYTPVLERPERNVTIINKTVNITNITYNTTNNRTVVYNGGPRYDVIRAKSQQPVEQVKVNFAPRNTTVNNTKIVNVVQGNNLRVAAPPVAAARQAAPRRVTQKLAKPTIDRGWEGVDPAQAQKVKQEMAETSVPKRTRPARPAAPAAPPAARPAVAKPDDAKVEPPKPAVVNPEPPKPAVERPQRPVAGEAPARSAGQSEPPKPSAERPQRPSAGETPVRPAPQVPPESEPPKPAASRPQPPPRPALDEAPAKPAVEAPSPKREPKPATPEPTEAKSKETQPSEPARAATPAPARRPPADAMPPEPPAPDSARPARATPAPRPQRLDRGPRPVPGAEGDQTPAPAARPRPPVEPAAQRPAAVPANPAATPPRPVRPPENRPQVPPEAAAPKPVRQAPDNVNRPPAPEAVRRNSEAPQRPPAPAAVQRPAAPTAQATPTPEEIAKRKKRDPNGAR